MAEQREPRRLSPEQWQRARAFLLQHARPLEATLYRCWFEQGTVAEVVEALTGFRNPDGGFGHALEPDLRTAASSVLATTTALQTLRELKVGTEHPFVTGALNYLLAAYHPMQRNWPLVPPAADDAPHAPWWNQEGLSERFGGFALNPQAEVLGYLYAYGGAATTELRTTLTDLLVADLALPRAEISYDEYLCVLRLAAAPGLPAVARGQVEAWLRENASRVVALDPASWSGYVLLPAKVAPAPDTLLAGQLQAAVQASLDFVIESQGEDGAWHPAWSWFGAYPADWPAAEREWCGVLTLERLRWLQHYGRL